MLTTMTCIGLYTCLHRTQSYPVVNYYCRYLFFSFDTCYMIDDIDRCRVNWWFSIHFMVTDGFESCHDGWCWWFHRWPLMMTVVAEAKAAVDIYLGRTDGVDSSGGDVGCRKWWLPMLTLDRGWWWQLLWWRLLLRISMVKVYFDVSTSNFVLDMMN